MDVPCRLDLSFRKEGFILSFLLRTDSELGFNFFFYKKILCIVRQEVYTNLGLKRDGDTRLIKLRLFKEI